jgi:hypothetical protein
MKKRVFSFFIFYTAELSNEMTGKGLDKTWVPLYIHESALPYPNLT